MLYLSGESLLRPSQDFVGGFHLRAMPWQPKGLR